MQQPCVLLKCWPGPSRVLPFQSILKSSVFPPGHFYLRNGFNHLSQSVVRSSFHLSIACYLSEMALTKTNVTSRNLSMRKHFYCLATEDSSSFLVLVDPSNRIFFF